MISPAYVRTMAAYNAAMNERLFGAAARLDDAQRKLDRGAFWGSIHRTLSHLLWGDEMWMSRFDGGKKPHVGIRESGDRFEDFATLAAARFDADRRIKAWSQRVDDAELKGELTWFSGAAQREITMPRSFLVMHFFNHQTHHRGQAHAMITACGEVVGDTDMFLIVPPAG